jgi:hypothetical protein
MCKQHPTRRARDCKACKKANASQTVPYCGDFVIQVPDQEVLEQSADQTNSIRALLAIVQVNLLQSRIPTDGDSYRDSIYHIAFAVDGARPVSPA